MLASIMLATADLAAFVFFVFVVALVVVEVVPVFVQYVVDFGMVTGPVSPWPDQVALSHFLADLIGICVETMMICAFRLDLM